MKGLTSRQRQVLAFVKSYLEEHGYSPSIRELSDHLEISVKGARDHLTALQKKGAVRFGSGRYRALEVLDSDASQRAERMVRIPLLGRVAAGVPLLAEENFEGTVGVSSALLGSGDYFAVRVQGDSMRDAGILDGDTAVVRHQETARNGDIVVATVEEAVTLKRFFLESNRVRLQAENPDYPPIFTQSLRILGKLSALLRAY